MLNIIGNSHSFLQLMWTTPRQRHRKMANIELKCKLLPWVNPSTNYKKQIQYLPCRCFPKKQKGVNFMLGRERRILSLKCSWRPESQDYNSKGAGWVLLKTPAWFSSIQCTEGLGKNSHICGNHAMRLMDCWNVTSWEPKYARVSLVPLIAIRGPPVSNLISLGLLGESLYKVQTDP